jgi:hypothetical protein
MASITTDENGRRKIQFIATNRRRKTIRLPKCSMKHAEAVKVHVEELIARGRAGQHSVPAAGRGGIRRHGDKGHDEGAERAAGV